MIEKADPRVRAIAVPAFAAMVMVGVALIASAPAWRSAVIDWVRSDPAQSRSRAVTVSTALAAAVIVPVVAVAGYLWRFGARVLRDRRFPPYRARLPIDVVVEEGQEARRRGRMLQVWAIALGAISLAFAIMFWRLIALTGANR